MGCDAGGAVSLLGKSFHQGTLSWIAAIGTRTVGTGVAWTVKRSRFSFAVGVAMPFDGQGIYLDELAPVVGATVSVGR